MSNDATKPKILFVEDDVDIASLYRMRMEIEGFAVTLCGDGESALKTAPALKPDIILLDLMLPKVDGFTALQSFRTMPEIKKTKIIVMSAIGEQQNIDRAMSLGADDYIVKSQAPIDDIMKQLWFILGGAAKTPNA